MKSLFYLIANDGALYSLLAPMNSILLVGLILICIVVVSKGADFLIDGVVLLAHNTGLPRIVIGATVVSLGTTTPEAVVSVMAAWMGNPGLALGNGVGSIIADTGLILGMSCILVAMPVNRFILNRTGWVQVGSATLLVIISLVTMLTAEGRPQLGRAVGVLFLVLLIAYLYMTYVWARQGGLNEESADDSPGSGTFSALLMVIGGLLMVVLGARFLVPCSSCLAHRMGVPDDVIAATLVAFGTSLPELITAIAAIRKGHPEITVGNVVGADVLNCLFVIGAASAARPLDVPVNFYLFHFPAMLLILYSFRVFISINRTGRFSRWQGIWLLSLYILYVILQYAFNLGQAGV